MIKINLEKEKEILNFHYNNLTIRKGKEWTVIVRINRLIRKYQTMPRIRAMYEYLLKNVIKDTKGFSILIAKPAELADFTDRFNLAYGRLITQKRKEEFKQIFYYKAYDNWNAYELAKKIGVNVCVYCNRSYTFTLGTDSKKGTRFQFDHFFHQSKYPYLALSFFNLIPSCYICNDTLKNEEEFSLDTNIHPYVEGFSNDLVFTIKPKNINFINGNHSAYRIKFKKGSHSKWNSAKLKSAFRNILIFRLNDLYNMHKDYVDEIIQKSIVYSPAYLQGLYIKYQGTLFKNVEDVNRFVLGNYTTEINYHKRVLSKLTTDISKELGLI